MASNTSNISESTPVRRGGKAISDEIRSRLIKAHETGLSYGQISELYTLCINNWSQNHTGLKIIRVSKSYATVLFNMRQPLYQYRKS